MAVMLVDDRLRCLRVARDVLCWLLAQDQRPMRLVSPRDTAYEDFSRSDACFGLCQHFSLRLVGGRIAMRLTKSVRNITSGKRRLTGSGP